jgi:S-formylglutathione hydrolase
MEKLITVEIQQVLKANENVGGVLDLEKQSVMGHSMGGHGAVTLYLKGVLGTGEGIKYKAASGFAPILHPVKCPWGEKAFKGYLKVRWAGATRQPSINPWVHVG